MLTPHTPPGYPQLLYTCNTSLYRQGQNGQNGQQQQQGGIQQLLGTILRFALMWYMMQYFKGGGQQAAGPGGGPVPAGASAPLYRKGELVDMYVFLSESPYLNVHDRTGAQLIWFQSDLPLASGPEITGNYTYRPSEVRRGPLGDITIVVWQVDDG